MVYFQNNKTPDGIVINITFETPSIEAKTISQEYSKFYLESIYFNVHICKKHFQELIENTFKGISKKDRCSTINHVVATINDYKRYVDDQERNKNK